MHSWSTYDKYLCFYRYVVFFISLSSGVTCFNSNWIGLILLCSTAFEPFGLLVCFVMKVLRTRACLLPLAYESLDK